MKRLLAITVAAFAVMLIFAMPSFAASGGVEECGRLIENGVEFNSGGQCLAVYQEFAYFQQRYEDKFKGKPAPGESYAVAECKFLNAEYYASGGLMGTFGMTFGECVEAFKGSE